MIDFELDPELVALRDRVTAFVRDVAIPAEARDTGTHGVDDELRAELQAAARTAGVFAPQVPREWGGLGLDMRSVAVVFEAAGYSVLGPHALNCAAPDEGNMHLLHVVATAEQKERFLAPLAAGDVRSCFAMTEPAPGAGSDPSMLATTATRVDGGWRIDGRKWFITGAEDAAFTICMALAPEGATMFLIDADNPGWHVERVVDSLDRGFAGGHAEVVFDGCVVGDEAVLGAVGEGFRYAQVRLAPARLTHCMRWLGAAQRALDVALDRASEREAFGSKLGELGMVQERIAESVIDIETSRLLIWRCAWALDRGEPARHESSIAKAHVGEAVWRVVDRAVQICGALGVSGDAPLAALLREVRPFRIYDGPTETHRWAIARRTLRQRERAVGEQNGSLAAAGGSGAAGSAAAGGSGA
ncbi:acyl-CoA dehydrogenase family protein [Conexibacter sp. CPCC 206217]|uniref:acyl-CoA dehydrogenase family protein n=1 Tax=Conexibacter sp. CPCC 206217 TaxID=3064574 RepID=UPI0027202CE7|nr:acyl-CoA dehydrogenase family protein [Conexibacter sp. CPCC 206217]MDO8212606.1 acyl-CoA dehydrogenase family protein [Conexibacter sp. CPCC 206217]